MKKAIFLPDYFAGYAGHPGITAEHRANAEVLLVKVNALLADLTAKGVILERNPKTGTFISGTKNGGWRPKEATEGALNSSHKEGRGVDVYDPKNAIDSTITDVLLSSHGLYREHPSQTPGWCHLTDRPPKSGMRTFYA